MARHNPFINYYILQSGGEYNPVVFQGYKYQRGRGFGSFFSGLFRRISPFLKTVGADIGKTLLHTGSNLIDDAVAGRNIKEAARERLTTAGKDILNQTVSNLKGQVGLGRKRKRGVTPNPINKRRGTPFKITRSANRKTRRNPKPKRGKSPRKQRKRKTLNQRQLFG